MLQFIQTGLSTASAEDDAMGVALVMDWVEGQLERFREGKEFERRGKSADEAVVAPSTSTTWRSFSPPRRQPQETRSPVQTPRKTEDLSAAVDSTPVPAPLFATDATPATKRRHAAITSVDPPPARRRSRVFAAPVGPGPSDIRQPRRAKRGGGSERERSVVVDNRSSDLMDLEEEGPRERKRSRTSRVDPASSST